MGVHLFAFANDFYAPCQGTSSFDLTFSHWEFEILLAKVARSAGLEEDYREWWKRGREWRRVAEVPASLRDDPLAALLCNPGRVLDAGEWSLTADECREIAPCLRELAHRWEPASPGVCGPRERAIMLADGLERAAARNLNIGIGE